MSMSYLPLQKSVSLIAVLQGKVPPARESLYALLDGLDILICCRAAVVARDTRTAPHGRNTLRETCVDDLNGRSYRNLRLDLRRCCNMSVSSS